MLSTRILHPARLRAAALLARRWRCSRPAPRRPARRRGDDGMAVDASQPVKVALLLPYGTGDPGREQIARSLENAARLAQADLRNATIDLVGLSDRRHHRRRRRRGLAGGGRGREDHRRPALQHRDRRRAAGRGLGRAHRAELHQQPLGRRRQRLHPRHHLREHRRPAGRLRPVARPRATSASSIPPGSRARPRATRCAGGQPPRRTLVASQPYNLSVEGIQAAGRPGRRGADRRRRQRGRS